MISLVNLNTFHINSSCKELIQIKKIEDIISFKERNIKDYYILGGGSNILLLDSIENVILKNELKGIQLLHQNNDNVILRIASGENWHDTVIYCINNNWCGIENLALIPGTVGGAPVQNIGAYGVEIKDFIYAVHGIDLVSGKEKTYLPTECQFAYRSSIFKTNLKNSFFITAVELKLNKTPKTQIEYGAIKEELQKKQIVLPTINDICQAVMRIRRSKLPDPKVLGNAGSFFKNAVISRSHYDTLLLEYPEIPSYKINDDLVKVPTGWLIEKAGWKGFRDQDAGCHSKQALVLVNFGEATGKDILKLATDIKKDVFLKFRIDLEFEVNIWT